MTLHFAAARTPARSPIARALARGRAVLPANDNGLGDAAPLAENELLAEALRHFAGLGIAAAHDAFDKARTALEAGRFEDFDRWSAICRTLDRRRAARLNRLAGNRRPR